MMGNQSGYDGNAVQLRVPVGQAVGPRVPRARGGPTRMPLSLDQRRCRGPAGTLTLRRLETVSADGVMGGHPELRECAK
jgi:hypothetical protein